MSLYSKISEYVSPAPMHLVSGNLNESEKVQNTLRDNLKSPYLSEDEKTKRLAIALERENVYLLNDWDLRYIKDFSLVKKVVNKVPYFKYLSINFTNLIIEPGDYMHIFDILADKNIESLYVEGHVTGSNSREFNTSIMSFLNLSDTIHVLRIENLHVYNEDTYIELKSKTLHSLSIQGHCIPVSESKPIPILFDLNKLPFLRELFVYFGGGGKITNIVLPKKVHPLLELNLPQSPLSFVKGEKDVLAPDDSEDTVDIGERVTEPKYNSLVQNLPYLYNLSAQLHNMRYLPTNVLDDKNDQIYALIENVLNNEGILSLFVHDQWTYFRKNDKLKKLTIQYPHGLRYDALYQPFATLNVEHLVLYSYMGSFTNFPINLKSLVYTIPVYALQVSIENFITNIAKLNNLEYLTLLGNSAYKYINYKINENSFLSLLPKSLKLLQAPGNNMTRRSRFLNIVSTTKKIDTHIIDVTDLQCPMLIESDINEYTGFRIKGELKQKIKIVSRIREMTMDVKYSANNWKNIETILEEKLATYYTTNELITTIYNYGPTLFVGNCNESTVFKKIIDSNWTFYPQTRPIYIRDSVIHSMSGLKNINSFKLINCTFNAYNSLDYLMNSSVNSLDFDFTLYNIKIKNNIINKGGPAPVKNAITYTFTKK